MKLFENSSNNLPTNTEADRRDSIIYCLKMITSDVDRFVNKYDHDYKEGEDEEFYTDLASLTTVIQGIVRDAQEYSGK